MKLRPSVVVLALLGGSILAFCLVVVQASLSSRGHAQSVVLVQQLGLSDLCLFTEARYTRHLSMADLHTPFQDHPVSLDHFPSGSLVAPSGTLGGMSEMVIKNEEIGQ